MSSSVRVKPIVLVTADVRPAEGYLWHAAASTYLEAIAKGAGALPLVLPALGSEIDIDAVLARVDGVLATGSRSNVHPARYGAAPDARSEPYDEARDATSLPLIRRAIALAVPLLAICRGMQELNVALGGTLHPEVHEIEGRMDHRSPASAHQDERFAPRHSITLKPGGHLAEILGSDEVQVNSLHRQAIDRLAPRLALEAAAPDGTIEAVRVTDAPAFALGCQWHPEYWVTKDEPSRRLFAAFGEAVRLRAAGRERESPASPVPTPRDRAVEDPSHERNP